MESLFSMHQNNQHREQQQSRQKRDCNIGNQYKQYLQEQFKEKELMNVKVNSLYEFRILNCFDLDYKIELMSVLQYIKLNKHCGTNDNHQMRESDSIIVQKLEHNQILNSSAIMVDNCLIQRIQTLCIQMDLSFMTWDSKISNKYKKGSEYELIQRLNSVDIVIMDIKEQLKIQQFLQNKTQVVQLEDEFNALRQLLTLIGEGAFLTRDINSELQQIRNNLKYVINKVQQPLLSLQTNNYIFQSPSILKVSGLSFQRFILIPGHKRVTTPIYSKCSWIFQAFRDNQGIQFHLQNSFLKKLEQQGLKYNQQLISIDAYKFLYLAIQQRSELSIECYGYKRKIELLTIKYMNKVSLVQFLDNNPFVSLPFNLIYIESQQPFNLLGNDQIDLQGVQNKLELIHMSLGKVYNPNIIDIIKNNIRENCFICCSDQDTTKFVFGCCGSVISANCLINLVKNLSYIKCPSCRTTISDETSELCFFVSSDQNIQQQASLYRDFIQCYIYKRIQTADSYVYGANIKQGIMNRIEKLNPDYSQSTPCHIYICIDTISPNLNFLYLDIDSAKELILYNIYKIVFKELENKHYNEVKVFVYSSNQSVINRIQSIINKDN